MGLLVLLINTLIYMKIITKPRHIKGLFTLEVIPKEWIFQDYTIGHSIVLYLILILSSLFQLIGFFSSEFHIGYNAIHHNYPVIQDPYFESINWGVVSVLALFQPFSLYRNPYIIIPYISQDLKYCNFTISILTILFFITRSGYDTRFAWIMNTISLTLSNALCIYAYIISIKNKEISPKNFPEFLGFRVLYSLLIPLISIELGCSLMFSLPIFRGDSGSDTDKVLGFITILFAIGVILLIFTKELWTVGNILYYLMGIFSIQQREICIEYQYDCSHLVKLLCVIYSLALGFGIGVVILYKMCKKSDSISIHSINDS